MRRRRNEPVPDEADDVPPPKRVPLAAPRSLTTHEIAALDALVRASANAKLLEQSKTARVVGTCDC